MRQETLEAVAFVLKRMNEELLKLQRKRTELEDELRDVEGKIEEHERRRAAIREDTGLS